MNAERVKHLGQYLTPVWAAEALVERYFSDLTNSDVIVEPTCGAGAFLGAIPAHIQAIGIEIDPVLAAQARENTGRKVIVGDFRDVPLDIEPTAIIGNPPFNTEVIDSILLRSHSMLPDGGRVGFILPAYVFQTAARVTGYAEKWSLSHEMIPKNIFPNLSKPLIFAMFTKDRHRKLIGFALYRETVDVQQLPKVYREEMQAGGGPVWLKVAQLALQRLGGEADLEDIYREVEGKRPTTLKTWRNQIRKVVRLYADVFRPVRRGRYALLPAAPA